MKLGFILKVVWLCTLICSVLLGAILAGITTYINLGIDTEGNAFGNWAMWCGSLFAFLAAVGAFSNVYYMKKENMRLTEKDEIEHKKKNLHIAISEHKMKCETYNNIRESFNSNLTILTRELEQHSSIIQVPQIEQLDSKWTESLKFFAKPSNSSDFKHEISEYVYKMEPLQKCRLIEYMSFVNLVSSNLHLASESEASRQHQFSINAIPSSSIEQHARYKISYALNSLKTGTFSRERLALLINSINLVRKLGQGVSVEMNKLRHKVVESNELLLIALSEVPDVIIINFLISRYAYFEQMGLDIYVLHDAIMSVERLTIDSLNDTSRILERNLKTLDQAFDPLSEEVQLFPSFARYNPQLPNFIQYNFKPSVLFD